MEFFATAGLINGLISIMFGLFIFLKDSKNPTNKLFFLLTVAVAVWSLSYWQWILSTTNEQALFWVRLFSIGSLFIPTFFFHWVLLTLKNTTHAFFLKVVYAFTFILLLFSLSPLFVAGVEPKLIFSYWPNPGILYTIYVFVLFGALTVYSIFLLIRKYLLTRNVSEKGQLLFISVVSVIGFGGGATNFFLWYDIEILPYGNFVAALFPLFLGYSMLKHKLFNTKVIATELLVFLILFTLFVQALLSSSGLEFLLRGLFFVVVSFVGYLLIRSVYREVEAREEIEHLAKELRNANAQLKELDQRKSEFLSLASHQLRTPLTAMTGYASMLLEGSFGDIASKPKDAISRIYESSKKLAVIVADFLTISRIEQNRLSYDMVEVDLTKIASILFSDFSLVAKNMHKNISFTKDFDECITLADEGKIKQIFSNLIDNAIKYTPEGEISLSLKKDIEKGVVRFAVRDSGVGMSEETISLLFKKFSRADNASKVNVSGSGLGLYIADKMLKAHGGRIWAESEGEGKGSTFFVELPLK